jgi:hypothetical protein
MLQSRMVQSCGVISDFADRSVIQDPLDILERLSTTPSKEHTPLPAVCYSSRPDSPVKTDACWDQTYVVVSWCSG